MTIQHYDDELSLVDQEACEKSTISILSSLKPKWSSEKIKFEYFTVGITNKIFATSHPGDKEQIIFRVFGKNTDKIIDRKNEINAWSKLAEFKLAAPLFAIFSNGIVCGYLKGKSLHLDQMKNEKIRKLIASRMAEMHNIIPSNEEATLFERMWHFNSVFIKSYKDEQKNIFFNSHFQNDIANDITILKNYISPLEEAVVFCHNDLLVHNIVYESETEKIHFIDYEYASPNFLLFDIANHFCEYAGVEDTPDYSQCLSKTEKTQFLQEYFAHLKNEKSEKELETILKKIPLFEAAAHLFWTIWALVQSQNSTIQFDYLAYAASRYEQYKLRLNKYVASL